MSFLDEVKSKKYAIIVLASLIIGVISTTLGAATVTAYAATTDYYAVKIGDETVAVTGTQEEANAIIDGVKNHYVTEGAEVLSIKCDPAITTEIMSVKKSDEAPKVTTDLKSVIDYVLTGTEEEVIYTIEDGDAVWDIASEYGFTVDEVKEMNEGVDIEGLHPGDTLNLTEYQPMVTVTVEQKVTSEKEIPFETVKKDSDELYEGETEVETEGENGSEIVTEQIVTVNGKVTSTTELSSEVTKEPVDEVVLEGTKERAVAVSGSSASSTSNKNYASAPVNASGSAIASYACQFVGNPYAYGGTSLTNGADCSGFVYAVYKACGISIPRVPTAAGYGISYSQAQPGDILVYPGHVSIYIGGGREVHAVNPRLGIAITNVGYVGPVVGVRRIA